MLSGMGMSPQAAAPMSTGVGGGPRRAPGGMRPGTEQMVRDTSQTGALQQGPEGAPAVQDFSNIPTKVLQRNVASLERTLDDLSGIPDFLTDTKKMLMEDLQAVKEELAKRPDAKRDKMEPGRPNVPQSTNAVLQR